jgi:2',3'-cyclic-nucleotide 2'-phosphodiesterase (5'-nucleotidase family)
MRRTIVILSLAAVLLSLALFIYHKYMHSPLLIMTTAAIQAGIVPSQEGEARVGGMLLLASALHTLRGNPLLHDTLLLDAGNSLFQDPDQYALSQKMPELLMKLRFDAITLGYRDFPIVRDLDWKKNPALPILACNIDIYDNKPRTLHVEPSKLFSSRGKRIAVIGAVDPGTVGFRDVGALEGVQILDFEHTVARIKEQVRRWLPTAGSIILLSSAIDPAVNANYASRIPRLDLIVGLGPPRHGSIARKGDTTIVSAARGGRTIGMVQAVQTSSGSRLQMAAKSHIDVTSDQFEPDPEFYDIVRRFWIDRICAPAADGRGDVEEQDHVIGFVGGPSGIPLQLDNPIILSHPFWSYFESPMLSLVADAMRGEYPRWEVNKNGLPLKQVEAIDIAFINSGAIEAGLPPGVVTRAMLRHALPYDDKLVKAQFSRDQIIRMLSSRGMKEHGILGASGLAYVWDYDTGRVVEGELKLLSPNGRAERLGQGPYNVLMSSFLATGGDSYLEDECFRGLRERTKQFRMEGNLAYPSMTDLVRRYIYRTSPIRAPIGRRARFLR